MKVPSLHLDNVSATTVPTPETTKTVPTWNPVRAATKIVAGNIVNTCWKPSKTNSPNGGTSFGRYVLAEFVMICLLIRLQTLLSDH